MSTSTPQMQDEPGRGRQRKRRLYALGACLLAAVPVVALFAAAVERVRDAAERAD
jgi:hypothetical protein